ncbi:hypothetical protein PR048_005371 [Dryococelus australis]|uniref:Uncharacterized protein n=1 Tax=Dryococelus australis TaxID=614101 RepID=A0ABQ9I822_9NEOP|nr:hypothetical protein PR048_005371 [Dryococelus australis]
MSGCKHTDVLLPRKENTLPEILASSHHFSSGISTVTRSSAPKDCAAPAKISPHGYLHYTSPFTCRPFLIFYYYIDSPFLPCSQYKGEWGKGVPPFLPFDRPLRERGREISTKVKKILNLLNVALIIQTRQNYSGDVLGVDFMTIRMKQILAPQNPGTIFEAIPILLIVEFLQDGRGRWRDSSKASGRGWLSTSAGFLPNLSLGGGEGLFNGVFILSPYYPPRCHHANLFKPSLPQSHFDDFLHHLPQLTPAARTIKDDDEATFHANGKVNRHNVLIWGQKHPHESTEHEHASLKSCFFALKRAPGDIIFQQNYAPPHWHPAVLGYLNEMLPQRWIGRGAAGDQALCHWPPRSLDLTSCALFLWGYIKDQVFHPPLPANIDNLKKELRTPSKPGKKCLFSIQGSKTTLAVPEITRLQIPERGNVGDKEPDDTKDTTSRGKSLYYGNEKILSVKQDRTTFSRLYISRQVRQRDLNDFFLHESQTYTPVLSENGNLHFGNKEDLFAYLEVLLPEEDLTLTSVVDIIVIDASKAANFVYRGGGDTFMSYDRRFAAYFKSQLSGSTGTLDVVLKNRIICAEEYSAVVVATRQTILFPTPRNLAYLTPCSYEEAATSALLHAVDGAAKGCKKTFIRTVFIDVVVLAATLHNYLLGYEIIWIALGTGNTYRFIDIFVMSLKLGPEQCACVLAFHNLTACDTTSIFKDSTTLPPPQVCSHNPNSYDESRPVLLISKMAATILVKNNVTLSCKIATIPSPKPRNNNQKNGGFISSPKPPNYWRLCPQPEATQPITT